MPEKGLDGADVRAVFERRCVAKACRKLWMDTRFVIPARFFACLMTAPMVLVVMDLPAIAPGKSHDTGR